MTKNSVRDRFLDLIDGILSADDEQCLLEEIGASRELSQEFSEYKKIVQLERALADEQHIPPAGLTDDIMRAVHRHDTAWTEKFSMISAKFTRYLLLPGAAAATAILALTLSQNQSQSGTGEIQAILAERSAATRSGPVLAEPAVIENQAAESGAADKNGERLRALQKEVESAREHRAPAPVGSLIAAIPRGQRAVTIEVDSTSGVEGWAAPGSKVDTLVTFGDKGGESSTRVAAENATVLSVGAASNVSGGSGSRKQTVTLAMPAEDAQKVQLAASQGKLGLTLRGNNNADMSSAISVSDSLMASSVPSAPAASGTVSYRDHDGIQRRLRIPANKRKMSDSGLTFGFEERRAAPAEPAPPPAQTSLSTGQAAATSAYARRYPQIAPYNYTPPRISGERYGQYEENPRQTPAEAPFSTFGIDVDTASYTNARRFLQSGALPPGEAVRIEEFINYFDYDYPSQPDKPFAVSYEIAPSPLEPERFLMKVGVKARDAEGIDSERGWNLVFLIDTSGSMASPDKLPLLKRSLKVLTSNMRPHDRISIVTYSGTARVALPAVSGERKEYINSVIDSLMPAGGTNGSAGIDLAYSLAEANRIPGGVNRVILATDGDFNVGHYHFAELMRLIEYKRRSGVTLTTLGFGTGNINEENMEQLANRGNGNYYYVDSFKEARRIFDENLLSTVEIVAKDVKLQVEFNPQHVLEYRLIGYDNRRLAAADFADDAKDAGEIGSGHTVTALYELVLADTPLAERLINKPRYSSRESAENVPAELSDELAYVKVRYKAPEASGSNMLTYVVKKSDVHESWEETSDDFRFAAAVSYFGHLLRGSRYVGGYDLSQVAGLARAALGEDPRGQRREFVELVENARFTGRR